MSATNTIKWLLLIYLSCICPALGPSYTYAAILKDIRMGDHDAFTRVVLEFDSQVKLPVENKDQEGLTLNFPSTEVNLIRKIPNYASVRIEKLMVIEKRDALAIQLDFNFDQYRYEFLELSEPYRLVIDIFPRTEWHSEPSVTKGTQPDPEPESMVIYPPGKTGPETAADQSGAPSMGSHHDHFSDTKETTSLSPAELASTGQANNGIIDSGPKTNLPSDNLSNKSGMQFYLIITLVVITIFILSLLVLMLLARYHWAGNNQPININELLRKQEDHIASINERIHEQLKRYDEA